jgi:hypothetical protein
MQRTITTNQPALAQHNERFDAAWRYRYGIACVAYTEHWITCRRCNDISLCAEGEMLNSVCLDIEDEMVEQEIQERNIV